MPYSRNGSCPPGHSFWTVSVRLEEGPGIRTIKGSQENQKEELEGCGKRKGLWVEGKKAHDGRTWVAEYVYLHMCEHKGCLEEQKWAHLLVSTVVTLKVTPLSQSTMNSLWEKGQFPILAPSLPA